MAAHQHRRAMVPGPRIPGTQTTASRKIGVGARWSDGIKNLSTILSILGLLLYVILWIGYATFYNRFHLSPRDLGFGYLDVLIQSAVAIAIVLGVLSWIAAFVFVLTRSLDGRNLGTLALILLLALGICSVNLLYLIFGVLSSATWLVLSLCLTAVVVPMLGPIVGTIRDNINEAAPHHARWRLGIVTLAIGALFAAGGKVLVEAYHDRAHVLNGEPASFTLFGFPVTGWGAQRASFEWTSGSTAPGTSRLGGQCLLYFGQSGGTAYFYRANKRTHRGEVLRIPDGSIVVHTGAGNVTCQTR